MADFKKYERDPANWFDPTTSLKPSQLSQTALGGNTYNTIHYPQELGTNRYPYSMMIYVNANSASELGRNNNGGVQALSGTAATDAASARGNNQGVTSIRNNTNATGAINSAINKLSSAIKGITTADFGQLDFIPSYKRLNLVIGLPIPHSIQFGSHAHYREASSGMLGTVIHDAANEGMGQAGKDTIRALTQGAISFGAGAAASASNAFVGDSQGATPEDIQALVQKMQGIAKNDRKEQVFQGMGEREFTFSWLFVPKSQDESNMIRNIIQWLKYNQYPEVKAGNGLQVILPNEFDLEFRFKAKEITGMPKITTCVLEDVSVNYTPLQKFVAFADTDNPVAIQLDLKFKELEPLVRSMVVRGY
jgi:hypothetical protein